MLLIIWLVYMNFNKFKAECWCYVNHIDLLILNLFELKKNILPPFLNKMVDEVDQWTEFKLWYELNTYCVSMKSIQKYGFYLKLKFANWRQVIPIWRMRFINKQIWGFGTGCICTDFQLNCFIITNFIWIRNF